MLVALEIGEKEIGKTSPEQPRETHLVNVDSFCTKLKVDLPRRFILSLFLEMIRMRAA